MEVKLNYRWLPSSWRRVGRRVLPKRVIRRISRRPVSPHPLKERVEIDIFDGYLRLSGALREGSGQVLALEVTSRVSGHALTVECDRDQGTFFFGLSLQELTNYFGSDPNTLDLWLVWVPTRRGVEPDEPYVPKKLRISRFANTYRPERPLIGRIADTQISFHITKFGGMSLVLGPSFFTRAKVATSLAKVRDGALDVRILVTQANRDISRANLVIRGRQTDSYMRIPMNVEYQFKRSRTHSGRLVYELSASHKLRDVLHSLPRADDTIDLDLELHSRGAETITQRVPATAEIRKSKVRPYVLRDGDEVDTLIPYPTFRLKNLSYRRETFAARDYRLMIWLAYLWPVFTLVRIFTRVWLVGEVPYKAQDNGFHIFRYIRSSYPARRVFYVIAADAKDHQKVAELGNVVDFRSRKHIWLSYAASRFAGSHHSEYLMPSRDPRVVRAMRGVRVFMQHGPTATKNVTRVYGRKTSQERSAELFLVTSSLEKRIVVEDYGYRPHQVAVTGFSRFDSLLSKVPDPDRVILVMPTWRESLMNEQAFLNSSFLRNWKAFLTSTHLAEVRAKHRLSVALMLHPNMRKYRQHFDLPGVTQVSIDEVDVQSLIRTGVMMVTDLSSVAWDFSYLQRPVSYFQFESAQFAGNQTSHIDYATSLPGPIFTTPEDLVAHIALSADRGFSVEKKYSQRSRAFLEFEDTENSARVFNAISTAWNMRTAWARVIDWRAIQFIWRKYRSHRMYGLSMQALAAFARLLPVTDDLVFETDRGRGYSDSPRYLYEELVREGTTSRIYWVNNTTQRFIEPGTQKLKRNTPSYWWRISRAKLVVSNQNLIASFKPHRKATYLQTWHGTPLKKMQHDVPVMHGRADDYHQKAALLTSRWSVLLSPSPFATAAFQTAFRFQGPILEVGYPRNDVFFWPDRHAREEAARFRLGLTHEKRKLILYAPTFRDDARSGTHWSHKLALDFDRFVEDFGETHVLLVRLHPLVRARIGGEALWTRSVIDVSRYPDIQELLMISDLLVTDYSSLFFDFSLLDRPMIFYAYDLEHYRDELRGFYLDYEDSVPGDVVRSQTELHEAIRDVSEGRDPFEVRRRDFATAYGPHSDGRASRRVLDALTEINPRLRFK